MQSPRARGLRLMVVMSNAITLSVAIPSCAGIETEDGTPIMVEDGVAIPSCAGIETYSLIGEYKTEEVAIPSCAGIETTHLWFCILADRCCNPLVRGD